MRGDFPQIVNLDTAGKFVPVRGPANTPKIFSSPRGSTPAFCLSSMNFAPYPYPPM